MGGHSLPRNINVGYVNGTRLNGLCCTCSTLNTLQNAFPLIVSLILTRSAFDTAGEAEAVSPKLSHISHIFGQEAVLLVLVGGRCQRELRREK